MTGTICDCTFAVFPVLDCCVSVAASLSDENKKDAIGDVIARNKRDIDDFPDVKELDKTDHLKRDIGDFPDAMDKTYRTKRDAGDFPDVKDFDKTDRYKRDANDFHDVMELDKTDCAKRDIGHFPDAEELYKTDRYKRDIYNSDDVPPYDLFYNERDRRQTDRRFDPFLFGSSDRFSHGFGKRRIAHGAAVALVGSSCSI